jgi:hypothetical protein
MRHDELANQLVERFYNLDDDDNIRLPEERLISLVNDTANKQAQMINSWGPFEQIMFCLQNGVTRDEIIKLLASE